MQRPRKQNRQAKRARAEHAKAVVADFSQAAVQPTDSGLSRAWRIFLLHERQHLAADLSTEPDAFCRPSVVIRRYLSLGATCKELHALVVMEALPLLAGRLPTTHWQRIFFFERWLERRELMRRVFREPHQCTLPDLKAAARTLSLQVGGTKPVVILRLLEFVHLSKPTVVPADLVFAVTHEKLETIEFKVPMRHIIDDCSQMLGSRKAAFSLGCLARLFTVRKYLTEAYGVIDEAGWQALLARYWALPEDCRPAVE